MDSRPYEDGIRRRRVCAECGHKWVTIERPIPTPDDSISRQELLKRFRGMDGMNGVGIGTVIRMEDALDIITHFPAKGDG